MSIPDAPWHEEIAGAVINIGEAGQHVLIAGGMPARLPGRTVAQGRLIIRYGIPFFFETGYLIPQTAFDDFQQQYEGEEALQFVLRKGYLFPRADVAGWLASDGTHREHYLKELDIASTSAFVYRSSEVRAPLARLDAVVWIGETEQPDLPARLYAAISCLILPADQLATLPERLAHID